MSPAELVTIGQIIKPFGVRGDVRVRSLTDIPGRFDRLGAVTLETPAGQTLQTSVIRVRPDRDSYVVGFEAFSSPEEAAAYRGALIKIERDGSLALPEGQYLECDLLGMTVRAEDGRLLGTLNDVLYTGSNAVFVVRDNEHEVLIPATKEVIVAVDVQNRTMTVRLIEGLLDSSTGHSHAV